MFAIFKSGGKQYKAIPGQILKVEKLEGDVGETVELDEILAVGSTVKDTAKASIKAEIIEQSRAAKILVFKKKRRHNYRRKKGHRQYQTVLRIVSITGTDGKTHSLEAKLPAKKAAKTETSGTKTAADKKPATTPKTEGKAAE